MSAPLAQSVLYLHRSSLEASPKTISGRTSYLRVRLAFHPYPQVIRRVFNPERFGPPREISPASPCPWVAHPVSGLRQQTNPPSSDSLSLRLQSFCPLASPASVTRRPVLQKVRRHPLRPKTSIGLRLLVGTRFQTLFHSPPGVLFTFPSRYYVHYRSLRGI